MNLGKRLADLRRKRGLATGELAAGVAHEIRNPLAAIVNATSLLGEEEHLTHEERASTLGAVRKEARRLNLILSDFLVFARPREPKPLQGDIREVIDHVAALVREDPGRARRIDLGVHLETCTNEAAAAAMLGASINYPLRGAVTWKSIVGTNVAADALSNLASPGVVGGVMIILGEDYGEGASVIQERSYAYALKSSMWLLDPRPDLPAIVRMVEQGFELSEASHAPVMMELRVRACHVTGEFTAKANRRAAYSGKNRIAGPPRFEYGRLAHPPVIFSQERLKVDERLPAAQLFIRERKLNEVIAGDLAEVGIIVLGGLTNGVLRTLVRLDLADLHGASRIPLYVLNVGFPLVPEELREFCAGKRAVLVVEEGSPDYIEQAVNVELRRADIATRVLGKGMLPRAGEYTS